MAHAERAGAEAGDVAAGLERIGRDRAAVEELKAVALGIVADDEVLHLPLVGERARAAGDLGAHLLEPRRDVVEGGGVRHLPAEEADALPAVGVDHEPLLAVVHAERHRLAALVDLLQAEEIQAVAGPVLQALGADPDISQGLNGHG